MPAPASDYAPRGTFVVFATAGKQAQGLGMMNDAEFRSVPSEHPAPLADQLLLAVAG
jgi:hypothetical protein